MKDNFFENEAQERLLAYLPVRLGFYLAGGDHHQREGQQLKDAVRSLLRGREEILAAADNWMDKTFDNTTLLEFCALAAERLGDDELTVFYAEKGVEQYNLKSLARASCRAILGRKCQQSGDHTGAVAHWRESAAELLEAKCPIEALRIAEDWAEAARAEAGGAAEGPDEEPRRLVYEACTLTGRPKDTVLREFREARAPAVGRG